MALNTEILPRRRCGRLFLIALAGLCGANTVVAENDNDGRDIQDAGAPVTIADPFVLEHDGSYYLYGTFDPDPNRGIPVRVSRDRIHWEVPEGSRDGLALHRDDVFGDRGFWAPSVRRVDGRFYMFYTANEHIAVAVSDTPYGPFTQETPAALNPDTREIDAHLFIDDDGRPYLFFVRLDRGNRIYAAELNPDLRSVKEDSAREIIHADQPWENSANSNWPVAESPSVVKHNGVYYLFYTANDFRNPDYNVGYAIAESPLGPWSKSDDNPLLTREHGLVGTGAAGVFLDPSGEKFLFYHAHASPDSVRPRRTVFSRFRFVPRETDQPAAVEIIGEPRIPEER